jgi:hypothetical protein
MTLVDDHGLTARYASVRRFVATLRRATPLEARVVIAMISGEGTKVDHGEGPIARWAATGPISNQRSSDGPLSERQSVLVSERGNQVSRNDSTKR